METSSSSESLPVLNPTTNGVLAQVGLSDAGPIAARRASRRLSARAPTTPTLRAPPPCVELVSELQEKLSSAPAKVKNFRTLLATIGTMKPALAPPCPPPLASATPKPPLAVGQNCIQNGAENGKGGNFELCFLSLRSFDTDPMALLESNLPVATVRLSLSGPYPNTMAV